MDKIKRSIVVVADTHFGLNKKDQGCDPNAFSEFLNWVRCLEEKGKETLNLGIWGGDRKDMDLKPPEKIIFLGDILELWDASKNSIDVSTRSIIQSISALNCEKIYVLGNHDYDLVEIVGKYPLGASSISIVDQEYDILKGDRRYLFLHGHQFDKYFTLPSWKFMPHIRRAALVFGLYTWIFVILFVVDLVFEIITGFGGIANKILFALLGMISIPFLIIKFGRKVWNNLRSTRYKPRDAEKGFERWWNKFSKRKENLHQNWNIVYGHTHIIDFWRKIEGSNILTLLNIPSWVRDSTEKREITLEKVFRHAFLYINEDNEFIGWDTRKRKPFLIPKEVIIERRESGNLTKLELYEIVEKLQEIGWPQELIDKWMEYITV